MNRTFKTLSLFFIASVALLSFTLKPGSGIKGTVAPAEGVAGTVFAISGTDTLKAQVAEGAFLFSDIKPGTYKVTVEAKAPYKNFEKEGIDVKDGEVVDLGAITLAQ